MKKENKRKKYAPFPCPWCLRELQANNVVFRVPAIDHNAQSMRPDAYLRNYKVSTGDAFALDSTAVYTEIVDPAFLHPGDTLLYAGSYLKGVRVVREGLEFDLEVRLCPHCHNPLHKNAGLYDEKIVAVVGTRNAGKSTFLASMLYQLRADEVAMHNVACRADGNLNRTIDEYLEILTGGDVVDSTHGKMEPITYQAEQLDQDKEPVFLTFQDIPGEDFASEEETKIRQTSSFIARAGLCIFLLDLENLNAAKQVADNLWHNYSEELKSNGVYMAMVLYKGDLLKRVFPDLKDSVDFSPSKSNDNSKAVSLKDIYTNSDAIYNEVVKAKQSLQQIENVFRRHKFGKRMRWFMANGMQQSCKGPGLEFAPHGCDQPILWWLGENGQYPVVGNQQ